MHSIETMTEESHCLDNECRCHYIYYVHAIYFYFFKRINAAIISINRMDCESVEQIYFLNLFVVVISSFQVNCASHKMIEMIKKNDSQQCRVVFRFEQMDDIIQ